MKTGRLYTDGVISFTEMIDGALCVCSMLEMAPIAIIIGMNMIVQTTVRNDFSTSGK